MKDEEPNADKDAQPGEPETNGPTVGLHSSTFHTPVLAAEALAGLAPRSGGDYLDATVGGGGHTAAILQASAPDGRVLGIDADPAALAASAEQLSAYAGRVALIHGNFRDVTRLARDAGFDHFDGVLFDLGVSSHQIDTPERGFTFQADAPLDMRLDPTTGLTAADLVNDWTETELANLIFRYGEERASRRIARFIAEARRKQRIETTRQLADLVVRALGGRHGKIHPATRTFQALRIAVNRELESLEAALPQAVALLVPGGRLAVIAFHSLEDRIVKQFFRSEASAMPAPRLRLITRKPLVASTAEVQANPRSRSAKLRIAERAVSRQ